MVNITVYVFVYSWGSFPAKDPLLTARNTVFFRTVELAYNQGTLFYGSGLLPMSLWSVYDNFEQKDDSLNTDIVHGPLSARFDYVWMYLMSIAIASSTKLEICSYKEVSSPTQGTPASSTENGPC